MLEHITTTTTIATTSKVKVKWPRYRPGLAQSVDKFIALLFHDRSTRMGWVVSRTPRPHFTTGKDPLPILQEAGWAPGPVWTGGILVLTGIRSPDRPARSQSLYLLSYPAHTSTTTTKIVINKESSEKKKGGIQHAKIRIGAALRKEWESLAIHEQ